MRRIGADLFLSPDGFLSARTQVPQVAVQHDLNFEHHPEWLPDRVARHYRRRFPKAAQRAVRLATVSTFSARDISDRYGIPLDRIDVVYNGAGAAYHTPLGLRPEQEATAIRKRFTGGAPYFVFVGTQHPRKTWMVCSKPLHATGKGRTVAPHSRGHPHLASAGLRRPGCVGLRSARGGRCGPPHGVDAAR